MFRIVRTPIVLDRLVRAVRDPAAGALVVFLGTTRNQNAGRRVVRLEYEAYDRMAVAEMRRLAAQAKRRWPIRKVDGAPDRVRADRPGERRDRGLGRAPRPGVRRLPLAHRSAEGDRADLEARALSRRPGVDRAAVGRPPAGARGAPPGRLMSPERLLSVITVDILVILVVSRLLGVALRAIGQPQVMGEVIGGILLGPSLLGWAAPGVSAGLFPPAVLPYLRVLSEYGIVFFMFLVGLELDPALMRGRGRAAVVTSHSSILTPFALGIGLAAWLYAEHAPHGVRFLPFALFMGASMSITAFPVLARILIERDLLKTKVGAVTIVCAAVDDVTAWCLLAFVV